MSGALQRLRGVKAVQHGVTLVGAVAAVGLLLAFLQVVSGAVQEGDRLHAATAHHDEATLRCRSLPGARLRANCLVQLEAESPRLVLLQEGDVVKGVAP